MNKFALVGAALSLVMTGPAMAQDDHHDHNTGHSQKDNKDRQDNDGHGAPSGQANGPDAGRQNTKPPAMGHSTQRTGERHHVDYGQFHRNIQASRRFQMPAYHRPRGWYAHRWAYGERLPVAFFAREYWIGNWGFYGLIPPPDGCVWVRVGDDAVLIDQYNGEVVQVVYGLFG